MLLATMRVSAYHNEGKTHLEGRGMEYVTVQEIAAKRHLSSAMEKPRIIRGNDLEKFMLK